MKLKTFRNALLVIALVFAFLAGGHPAMAAAVTVDTTADVNDGDTTSVANLIADPGPDGYISLREAIIATNNSPGADTINFNISGCAGACEIRPATVLPMLTGGITTIDGYSQPGAVEATGSSSATIMIQIYGADTTNQGGIVIYSADNVVKGLAIYGYDLYGVGILGAVSTGNVISGNYIGVMSGGGGGPGNGVGGVLVSLGASDNTIGGDEPAERNIISANGLNGVDIINTNSTGNTVSGNYIGTDDIGVGAVPNSSAGVFIGQGAHDNIVGGSTEGERNVISGNTIDGVAIHGSATHNNTVIGNYVGLSWSGMAEIGNGNFGVDIYGGAYDNTVGGTIAGEGNVISGNHVAGVRLYGTETTANSVVGNIIGLAPSGSEEGNWQYGVFINEEAHNNTIGGTSAGERNIISGNTEYGVFITGASDSNTISGNYIGTDPSGVSDRGNGMGGVLIVGGSTHNTIGGSTSGERNVIAGNDGPGVGIGDFFDGPASENTLSGNYIGTDVGGSNPLPNYTGVRISNGSSDNLVGGSTTGERNVISGNSGNGVGIRDEDSDHNTVSGNYIGVDVDGDDSLGNGGEGVWIQEDAQWNVVGGDEEGERNIISGNGHEGVLIEDSATSFNQIMGNYIGTDVSGALDLGNGQSGINLLGGAHHNLIGGNTLNAGNLISGNTENGIVISDEGTEDNRVSGNIIGLDATGTTSLPNDHSGIWIHSDADNNIVGGTLAIERNVISANDASGISISSSASGNQVLGNFIGTDITGSSSMGNHTGVYIDDAPDNVIGGSSANARNVISGQSGFGVNIDGGTSTGNVVSGNYIGTDAAGTSALPNALHGVFLHLGANNNTIGGSSSGDQNLISGNTQHGVLVEGESTDNNTIIGNLIGTDVSGYAGLANDRYGIYIRSQASDNIVGPDNIIANNGYDGVSVEGVGTTGNSISENSIFSNTDLGIDLTSSGNTELAAPTISSASCSGPAVGTACLNCVVEVFSDAVDEGRFYEGSTTADGTTGAFSLAGPFNGPFLTATATDASGNTSEFSVPYDVGGACNTPPTASFTVSPSSADRCTVFHLDASGSSDLEDATALLEVRWDRENDGIYDTAWSTGKTLDDRWLQAGSTTVRMQVRDTGGLTDTTTRTFTVTSDPCQTFADVPYGHWAWSYVEGIAAEGITSGCGGGNYCPDLPVSRAQMAKFLLVSEHGSGYTPPSGTGTMFDDVPPGHLFLDWVEQLASEGITSGCSLSPPLYCPDLAVSRAQMAKFLLITDYGSGYTPPTGTGAMFSDVPPGHLFLDWIEQLAIEGITSGCAPGLYCPDAAVSRAQMAKFLVSTFEIPAP